MVRVNLLPHKKRPPRMAMKGSPEARWFIGFAGVVVIELIAIALIHRAHVDTWTRLRDSNQSTRAKIDAIQRQISDHAAILAQLKVLREREEAIRKLEAARSGPTKVLLDLSRMLSFGRGLTVDREKLEQLRRDSPAAVPSEEWDPGRLWLTKYAEADRAVRIAGYARDAEDVSEFLRRLTLSAYFADIKLLPASKVVDPVSKLEVLSFELSAMVRY